MDHALLYAIRGPSNGMAPQWRTIRARAHWQPLSWFGWGSSSATVRGWGQSQSLITPSASEAAIKKAVFYSPSLAPNEIMSLTQRRDADHVEWRGRANALSSAVTARHVGINPTWARLSPAAQILCPLFFSSQIPWRKKTGGREGWSRSLKRKLTTSAERQDWNTRSASISPSVTHTQHECHQRVGDSRTSYNDGATFATTLRWKFALLVGLS